MAKYELRTKTKFGEIVFHFDSTDEAQQNLANLDLAALEKSAAEKLGAFIVTQPRQPKQSAEFAYKFTPEGKVELNRVPSSAPTTIGLLLYAYDPDPVDPEEVFRATGVKPVAYITQTGYKKYFDKTGDGKLLLTHPGRLWVQNEVLPELKRATVPSP